MSNEVKSMLGVEGGPKCTHEGCTKPARMMFRAGPRCPEHLPIVPATIRFAQVTLPMMLVQCSECGFEHQVLVDNADLAAMAQAAQKGDVIKGQCGQCNARHEAKTSLIVTPNLGPNRHERRAAAAKGEGPSGG